MVWIIVIAVVAILVIYLIGAYNGLIRGRNQIENAWSQIDVQLKRRIDLIPNLVETVKAYAEHEKSTLEAVINARNAAIQAPSTPHGQAQADAQMTGALRQLFALGEAYPDLAGNATFVRDVVAREEERFRQTLRTGTTRAEDHQVAHRRQHPIV